VSARPLARRRSGVQEPSDTYAVVRYKGRWHWIDDTDGTDVVSKTTFKFRMILFSLAETGQATATPVVTVPSR
jgi:hypothetical protein